MRILLISPLYYPSQSPNVYRWDAIAKHWISQGHEVHWLCTKLSGEPAEAKINGIFVHRVGHNTLMDWWLNISGRKKERRGVEGSGLPQGGAVRDFVEAIVTLTWRKIYWPDGTCLWYRPAVRRALMLLKSQPFDFIVSVSLPFTAVMIATSVKMQFPRIKWVMDIEDPFSFVTEYKINNSLFFKKLNRRAEAKALNLSDVVTVTLEAAKNKYLAIFPSIADKTFVVPPLFDGEQPAGSAFLSGKGLINIGYFGTFYYPIRSPKGFLTLLRSIKTEHPVFADRLKVHFVGTIPFEYSKLFEEFSDISDIAVFYGLVSREKTKQIIGGMDFLVNIGNTTSYHLPSKSAEYLMTGKPLINIASTENDSFAEFMKGYPFVLNLLLKEHCLGRGDADKFIQFVDRNIGRRVDAHVLELVGKNYSVEAVANRYMGLMIGVK